ncbi:MAG: CDGSH iron-sulfur domain-containing protein [Candidatus Kapaibacterium sp.]
MPEPKIAQKAPYGIELEPGKYFWCTCGESANQPFCDGSHKKEGKFRPQMFEVTEKKTVYLCGCKNTKSPVMCDGTHKSL